MGGNVNPIRPPLAQNAPKPGVVGPALTKNEPKPGGISPTTGVRGAKVGRGKLWRSMVSLLDQHGPMSAAEMVELLSVSCPVSRSAVWANVHKYAEIFLKLEDGRICLRYKVTTPDPNRPPVPGVFSPLPLAVSDFLYGFPKYAEVVGEAQQVKWLEVFGGVVGSMLSFQKGSVT